MLRSAHGKNVCIWPVFTSPMNTEGDFLVLHGELRVFSDYVIVHDVYVPLWHIAAFNIEPNGHDKEVAEGQQKDGQATVWLGNRPGNYL